jgi:DNA-binding CsgD family transcriptional regulator
MRRRPALLARVLDHVKLPVFVFEGGRQIYANDAGLELQNRLRAEDRIEVRVLIVDHLAALDRTPPVSPVGRRGQRAPSGSVTLLTSPKGEPFYVHVIPLPPTTRTGPVVHAVTVRSTGADVAAFRQRYRLTAREGQITELIRRGWGNREIADLLGITLATTKKHVGRVFDKVGADSRAQLMAKLG